MRKILAVASILLVLANAMALDYLQDRHMEIGRQYFDLGYYQDALIYFVKGTEITSNIEFYYWKAKALIALQRYDEAYENLEIYLKKNFGAETEDAQKLAEIIQNVNSDALKPNAVTYHSLGKLPNYVNSQYSDYAPVVTEDGKTMYFTSMRIGSKNKENIWKVTKVGSVWGNPQMIESLSSEKNEANGSISEDESKIYLFGHYDEDKNIKSGDIYYSNKIKTWDKPRKVENVNSRKTDTQPCVFEDKYMFFSSNRDGGIGGTDIYMSVKENGVWSEPINLGPTVNSDGNEQTPFLDWDGESLFFSSNGHAGLGGYDIFKVKKIGQTWTEWSEPENLGVSINTVRNERGYFHRKNSNEVYISSDRIGGLGFEDIYMINMKTVRYYTRPTTVKIFGQVTQDNEKPVRTEIIWEYVKDEEINSDLIVTDENGYFEISLPESEEYEYRIDQKGFFASKGSIQKGEKKEIETNILLNKLEIGSTMVLDNIYFELGNAVLKDKSFPMLDQLAETLTDNPKIRVEIAGHTDSQGTSESNLKLSQDRANSVVGYLISKGIAEAQLIGKGYGEDYPIADNANADGRSKNRRVELTIIEEIE